MNSFKVTTTTKNITLNPEIKKRFQNPLIFYLCRLDIMYLCIFVIVDFQKEEIIYINTFSEENMKKLKENYDEIEWSQTPHSSLAIQQEYEFINFPFNMYDKRATTFRKINTVSESMNVYSSSDLPLVHANSPFENSDTSEKDGEYFWISYTRKDKRGSDYYRIKQDFSDAELVFSEGNMVAPPHQIMRINNWVFSTGFYDRKYKMNGMVIENEQLKNHLLALQKIAPNETINDLIFGYDPEIKQVGNFFAYNYEDGKIYNIETVNAPSHIEYDEVDNSIFVLSNNITTLPGQLVFYLGPGYIEKFSLRKDMITKRETIVNNGIFSNEKGYRFTTHKFFRHKGNPYIATFGHPNRLFIIDGNTMNLWYYYDIDYDYLSNQTDCRKYLNDIHSKHIFNPHRMTSLEVSDDGDFLIFINQEDILFFDVSKKEITERVPYYKKEYQSQGFGQLTLHCDYLRY